MLVVPFFLMCSSDENKLPGWLGVLWVVYAPTHSFLVCVYLFHAFEQKSPLSILRLKLPFFLRVHILARWYELACSQICTFP